MIKQVTVFLENSEGRLSELAHAMGKAGVNMQALTIADTADYGVVRIICDDAVKAVEALNNNGFRAITTDVAAVEIPNRAGGMAELMDVLAEQNLNIEYGYCFSAGDRAVDVFKIKNVEAAAGAIEAAGFKMLTEADL